MLNDGGTAATLNWRSLLRGGNNARLRGSIDLDHASVPVEVRARVDARDPGRVSIELTLPAMRTPVAGADPAVQLTPRERKVVALIAQGHDTDEIAVELVISPATVRTHVRNAMSRFGTRTRAQLVATVITADANGVPSHDPAESPS